MTGPDRRDHRPDLRARSAAAGSLATLARALVSLVGRADKLDAPRSRCSPARAARSVRSGDRRHVVPRGRASGSGASRSASATIDVLVDNAGAIYPDAPSRADGIEMTPGHAGRAGRSCSSVGVDAAAAARRDGARVICRHIRRDVHAGASTSTTFSGATRPYNGTLALCPGEAHPGCADARVGAAASSGRGHGSTRCTRAGPTRPGLRLAADFRRVMQPLLRTPEQGADTIVWLATTPTLGPGGRLYLDRRPRPFDRVPRTRLSAADRPTCGIRSRS